MQNLFNFQNRQLSTDLKYLLYASHGVVLGKNKLGKNMLHFLAKIMFWHLALCTMVDNRQLNALFLPVHEDPEKSFQKLLDYVMKVYANSWFCIK